MASTLGAPPHRTLVPVLHENRLLQVGGEAVNGGLHVGPVCHRTHLPPSLVKRSYECRNPSVVIPLRQRSGAVKGLASDRSETPPQRQ